MGIKEDVLGAADAMDVAIGAMGAAADAVDVEVGPVAAGVVDPVGWALWRRTARRPEDADDKAMVREGPLIGIRPSA